MLILSYNAHIHYHLCVQQRLWPTSAVVQVCRHFNKQYYHTINMKSSHIIHTQLGCRQQLDKSQCNIFKNWTLTQYYHEIYFSLKKYCKSCNFSKGFFRFTDLFRCYHHDKLRYKCASSKCTKNNKHPCMTIK